MGSTGSAGQAHPRQPHLRHANGASPGAGRSRLASQARAESTAGAVRQRFDSPLPEPSRAPINCYIEPDAQILEHLPHIVRGTEDLLLAGLPRAALAFVWYQYQQEFGTHPHGGLLRLILPGGHAYVQNLNPELLLHFDRLMSRRFGFVDPLDPRGHRLLYAAWVSTKHCSTAEIEVACKAVQRAWKNSLREEFSHERVRHICEENSSQGGSSGNAAPVPDHFSTVFGC